MVFKLKMTGANCVLLCAALFSSSLTAYATEKSADSMADSSASGVVQGKIAVSGTVKDKNGEPLIGVSVVEKGTTNGMITDLDGNFGLSVSSPEAVLEFSYVGYNPVSVKVGDRTFFAIEMGESTQNLDEVVVTALGIKREKKMLGYAVQDIKADKLNTTGDPSVIGALSGKVAGLQMNTAGTGLSGSTKITLRGNSSLTDNNQPLWVVDGVPFSDNSSSDASLFDDVDHYDIYLTRNGEKVLVGQTRNEGFYIPKFTRISGEESVEVSVVTVTKDLKESEEETLTLEYPEMTVSDVNIVASPTLVKVGEEVTLTAVANKYPDSYEWVLPTGASIVSQEGNTAKVTFSQEGSYSITVKVTNPIGVATETNTGLIEVNNTKEITNVALGKDIEDVSGEIAASGEVATNLTDGNHSTAYLPDFYAAAGQSVRFVYTFDAPKSVSRFQAYFLEPDNIESALPTEVKFEVSENGTDFDVVNTAAAGTDVSYNLPEARDAKAVAFTIGLGLWMTTPIAELEVYGKDGTAIDEITVSRVLVAPNPVNQGQKMAVAADQAESIEIYSMQGALVKAERAEETITFVSTDDLTPGIYFMVVKGADYTETVKVIVK